MPNISPSWGANHRKQVIPSAAERLFLPERCMPRDRPLAIAAGASHTLCAVELSRQHSTPTFGAPPPLASPAHSAPPSLEGSYASIASLLTSSISSSNQSIGSSASALASSTQTLHTSLPSVPAVPQAAATAPTQAAPPVQPPNPTSAHPAAVSTPAPPPPPPALSTSGSPLRSSHEAVPRADDREVRVAAGE